MRPLREFIPAAGALARLKNKTKKCLSGASVGLEFRVGFSSFFVWGFLIGLCERTVGCEAVKGFSVRSEVAVDCANRGLGL